MTALSTVLNTANQTTAPQQLAQSANSQRLVQQTVATAVSTGAVVVQLTSNRAASHGDSRQTDASFEKQHSDAEKKDKKDVAEKKQTVSVNVAA